MDKDNITVKENIKIYSLDDTAKHIKDISVNIKMARNFNSVGISMSLDTSNMEIGELTSHLQNLKLMVRRSCQKEINHKTYDIK